MIVLLDTNVLISALVFGSPSSTPVLALARATDQDQIATCAELRFELFRILSTKFAWTTAVTETTLNHIFKDALRVTLHGTVHLCRDPADDMLLECAERAQADLLITGDKDLLALNLHGATAIVTPAAYLLL
jgi:uncharacterized protein